jgi:phosphoribosylformylglycinamidine synthase
MAKTHKGAILMLKPEICVLKTDGTNCDMEMQYALENSGARASTVHINDIRGRRASLDNFSGLALPGGFSYGDDIASGAVLANELKSYLGDEIKEFAANDRPILGVCNGFQVLARTGLLPEQKTGEQSVTLTDNLVGHFACKWVDLDIKDSRSKFVDKRDFEEFNGSIPAQIAHGEGRFLAGAYGLKTLKDNKQIVFTYADNPNGSDGDIAGICDKTGLILGMMPHPERSVAAVHPDRSKTAVARSASKVIFENFVKVAGE